MARRKITKKQQKEIEKAAKKHPILTAVVLLLIIVIVGCCLLHRKRIIHIPFLDGIIPQETVDNGSGNGGGDTDIESAGGAFSAEDIQSIKDSKLSIHFLELGNAYTGDCTLIKVGNTEVLIDAGSRKNSAPTIKEHLDTYCEDGVLEYVIATHAHQDHIAGFIGNKNGDSRTGIFYQYEIGTLIQFARSDQELETEKGNPTLYAEYLDAVTYVEQQGTTVYTALDCWNEANGAKKSYYLDAEQTVSMNILYNYFYEHDSFGGGEENEYSVCMLLTQGENNYLFTGDLEEKGEEFLVQYNTLPQCQLFKGGHHGSYTASSEALLSVIQPEIVCVCCCCGNMEYADEEYPENDFPSQAFVDRVSKYTERVYVTTMVSDNEEGHQSMNGTIILTSAGEAIMVRCSNNDTLFKDTDWFKENRICPDKWKMT